MMHPPDPGEPRRNVHIAMKVSIMTDGPGGITLHQAVNTPGYVNEQMDTVYAYPYNALGFDGFEPSNNMITWPMGATSETQTEGPIVQMPADTTKDSEQDVVADLQQKPEIAEGKKKKHHRHSHKHRSRSGADSRSQSSLSVIKSELNESRESPSEQPSVRSRHKSQDGSSRKTRSRHGSEKNYGIPDEILHTPRVVSMEDNMVLIPTPAPRLRREYSSETSEFLGRFPRNYFEHRPVFMSNTPSVSVDPGSDIFINTFSDDQKPETVYVPAPDIQASTSRLEAIFARHQSRENLETLLARHQSRENLPTESANISPRSKSEKHKKRPNLDGISMGIQCDGLPQPMSTQTEELTEDRLLVRHSKSAPDFFSMLEPIVKLTEQLAVANLKEKIIVTEKTETEVTTYTETLINEPPFMSHSRVMTPARSNPAIYIGQETYAPFETLINDVGVESKEIQTSPEKVTTGTSMDTISLTSRSKSSAAQISLDESTESSVVNYPRKAKREKQNIPVVLSAYETVIDDVGVESKQIQTLPEKVSAGTNTDDLNKSVSPKDTSARAEPVKETTFLPYDPFRRGSEIFSDLSVQFGSEVQSLWNNNERSMPKEVRIIPTKVERLKSPVQERHLSTIVHRDSLGLSDMSVQIGSVTNFGNNINQQPYRQPVTPEKATLNQIRNKSPVTPLYFTTYHDSAATSDLSVQMGSSAPTITTADENNSNNQMPVQKIQSSPSLQSRDNAITGTWFTKETNIDDVLDNLPYEIHSAMEMRPQSAENYAYESSTPQGSCDQLSEASSTVKAHSASKSSGSRDGSKTSNRMANESITSKQSSKSASSSKSSGSYKNSKTPNQTATSKQSSSKSSLSSKSSSKAPSVQDMISNEMKLRRAKVDELSSNDSGSGRQTPLDQRLAKHTTHMKQMRQEFFEPYDLDQQEKPAPNSIHKNYAQPITSLEQLLQKRLKSIEQPEIAFPSKPVLLPVQTPLPTVVQLPVPTIVSTPPPTAPPPPPPPPPSVISKLPVPLPKPTSTHYYPSQKHEAHLTKEVNVSSPNDSSDQLQYREFVVQHRLMPSTRIFEMHTKGPLILQYTKSPRASPSEALHHSGTYKTIVEESDQQSSVASVDDERSSISGHVHKGGNYKIVDIGESVNLEHEIDYNENRLTPANTWGSQYSSNMSRDDSLMGMTSTTGDRWHPFYDRLQDVRSKTPGEIIEPIYENIMGTSIDSERSSLSGAGRKGAYNIVDNEGYIDENLSDYLQTQFSPMGRIPDNSSYGHESPIGNSMSSNTSLKADQSHKIYSELPESTVYPPQSERSFADIMRNTTLYVLDRQSIKTDPVNESQNESMRSRSSSKTLTNDGSSIDHEGSGIYVIKPNGRRSRDMLDDTSSTFNEENFRDYTQGRISPMVDTNLDSMTSTLTSASYADYKQDSVRIAQLVQRPSMNLSGDGIYQGQAMENKLGQFDPVTVANLVTDKVTLVTKPAQKSAQRVTFANMKPPMQTEL